MSNENTPNPSLPKPVQIVEWLENEPAVSRRMQNSDGFFVNRGTIIQLADGREVEIMKFLAQFGNTDGAEVGRYTVKYYPGDGKYREKLAFFAPPSPVRVPFGV